MSTIWIVSYIGWLLSAGWFVFKIARKESASTPFDIGVGICGNYVYYKVIRRAVYPPLKMCMQKKMKPRNFQTKKSTKIWLRK